jgi:hypothetical protein
VIGGTTLADDDVAGANDLATELLQAQALRFRITPVPGAATCFLVCHGCFL